MGQGRGVKCRQRRRPLRSIKLLRRRPVFWNAVSLVRSFSRINPHDESRLSCE